MATNTFSNVSIPVGTQTFGPVNIPDGLTLIQVRFSNWSQPNRILAVQFEISVGGGPFEQFFNLNPFPGGRIDKYGFGTDVVATVGPIPPGINRRGQAVTTVTGGTVVTTITITSS